MLCGAALKEKAAQRNYSGSAVNPPAPGEKYTACFIFIAPLKRDYLLEESHSCRAPSANF